MLNKVIAVAAVLISLDMFYGSWLLFGFDDDTRTLVQVLFGESGLAWMLFALGVATLGLAFLTWRNRALEAVMPLTSLVAVKALSIGWSVYPEIRAELRTVHPEAAYIVWTQMIAATALSMVPGAVILVAQLLKCCIWAWQKIRQQTRNTTAAN